ncbi:hypothetical protein [Humidesulfovibrio idahonensis]
MGEQSFSSLEAVRRFLNEQGYLVTKSTINRHKDDGKIRPEHGEFSEAAALKYAKSFLKRADTGKRADQDTADQQRRFLTARADKAEQEAQILRLKTLEQEGKLIPREQVSQDLAARAVMLKSGLKHLVQSNVNSWVHLVSGDPRKAADLLRELMGKLERLLSDYAGAESLVLVFVEEEEAAEIAEENRAEENDSEAGNLVA